MEDKLAKLQEIVDTCSNIVFFGGAAYQPRAGYRISAASTDFII